MLSLASWSISSGTDERERDGGWPSLARLVLLVRDLFKAHRSSWDRTDDPGRAASQPTRPEAWSHEMTLLLWMPPFESWWPYSFECLLLSPLGTLLSPSTKSTQWIQPFEFWILLIKKREKGHSPWIQPSDLPPPWEIEGDRLAFQLCLIVKDLIPIIIYWIRPVQLGIPLDVREREPQKIWKSKTYSPENSDWSYTATTEIPELIFSCYGTVNILWTSPGLDDYEKRFLWRNWVGRKGLPKGLNMVSLANGEITFSQKIACRSSCFS